MGKNSNRVVQHKPQRESEARERADLKREIKALKKQVTRLRRQNQKIVETHTVAEVEAGESTESVAVQEGAPVGGGCANCGGFNMVRMVLPGGAVLIGCKDCKHRRKET